MRTEQLGALIAVLFMAVIATAAEPTAHERAAASFQQARAAFARREFTAAAAAFEQAAQYEPHPIAWLDAAEAWANADEPLKAAVDCERALQEPEVSRGARDEAEARLKVLGKRIATLQIQGETGQRATLDGGAPFALPARKRTTAGRHVVSVTGGSAPAHDYEITTRIGETTSIDVTAPPVPPPPREAPPDVSSPPPRPSSTDRSIPVVSFIAFGAAAVSAGATTVFAFRTMNARDDFNRTPTESTRDAFYRERLATNVLLGAAIVGVGIGVTFWLLSPAESRSSQVTWRDWTFGP